jgi:hypothetical protein
MDTVQGPEETQSSINVPPGHEVREEEADNAAAESENLSVSLSSEIKWNERCLLLLRVRQAKDIRVQ